jgi:hypothetical protein
VSKIQKNAVSYFSTTFSFSTKRLDNNASFKHQNESKTESTKNTNRPPLLNKLSKL